MLRRRENETNKRISNLTSNVLLLKRDVQLQAGRERLMIERLQREREIDGGDLQGELQQAVSWLNWSSSITIKLQSGQNTN